MLNVNIPAPSLQAVVGFKVTRLGVRMYSNDIWERTDPRQGKYLWIGGTRVTMEDDPETDCGAIRQGYVTITPITPDVMAYQATAALESFDGLTLPGMAVDEASEGRKR